MPRKARNTTQQKGKATHHNLPKTVIFQRKIDCLGWDSNQQPSAFQGTLLPTKLLRQLIWLGRITGSRPISVQSTCTIRIPTARLHIHAHHLHVLTTSTCTLSPHAHYLHMHTISTTFTCTPPSHAHHLHMHTISTCTLSPRAHYLHVHTISTCTLSQCAHQQSRHPFDFLILLRDYMYTYYLYMCTPSPIPHCTTVHDTL